MGHPSLLGLLTGLYPRLGFTLIIPKALPAPVAPPMAKIGPKELEIRARREARASKVAKPARKAPKPARPARVAPKPVVRTGKGNAKPSQRSKKRRLEVPAVTAGPATPPPIKLGRPSTGFDRASYQRLYMRLRKLHPGPARDWPEQARLALRTASRPTPT